MASILPRLGGLSTAGRMAQQLPHRPRGYAARVVRVMDLAPKKEKPRLVSRFLIDEDAALCSTTAGSVKTPDVPAGRPLFRSATIRPDLPEGVSRELADAINTPSGQQLSVAELHYVFNLLPRAYMSAAYKAQISALRPGEHSAGLADALTAARDPAARNASDDVMLAAMAEPTEEEGSRRAVLERRLDMMRRILSVKFAGGASVSKWNVARSVEMYQRTTADTNSSDVQVAVFSSKIHRLQRHILRRRKDVKARYKLRLMLGQRFNRMRHLRGTDFKRFNEIIRDMGVEYDIFNNSRIDYDKKMLIEKNKILFHRRRKK